VCSGLGVKELSIPNEINIWHSMKEKKKKMTQQILSVIESEVKWWKIYG